MIYNWQIDHWFIMNLLKTLRTVLYIFKTLPFDKVWSIHIKHWQGFYMWLYHILNCFTIVSHIVEQVIKLNVERCVIAGHVIHLSEFLIYLFFFRRWMLRNNYNDRITKKERIFQNKDIVYGFIIWYTCMKE